MGIVGAQREEERYMNFMYERQSRRYFLFILFFAAMVLAFCGFTGWLHGTQTKRALLEREKEYVSAMLERGISPEDAAGVIANGRVTEEGAAFLSGTGRTEETNFWWLPTIRKSTAVFLLAVLMAAVLLCGLLIGGTAVFLERRDRLYRKAEITISRFAEGNFKERLRQDETGTLYQCCQGSSSFWSPAIHPFPLPELPVTIV